jgi:hypothetical protein
MKVFFEGTPESVKREMLAWISGVALVGKLDKKEATALKPEPAAVKPGVPDITAPVDEPVLAEVPKKTELKSEGNPTVTATPVAPTLFPQAPAAQPAPAPQPAAAAAPIPKAPDKTYSLEDLMRAAAPLLDKGLGAELAKINTLHGVKSFNEIPASEFGQVAVELRALGAQL